MTQTPPIPEAGQSPYPIEEPPHEHPTGPNGEPLHFADAVQEEHGRLTREAMALLGVAAAIGIGALGALARMAFKRSAKPAKRAARAKRAPARKPARA